MKKECMRVLAIDLGTVRTGLAISDADRIIASPLTVITERKVRALVEKILCTVRENAVSEIVIGDPVNMNGSRGEKSEMSAKFAELLREELSEDGIPVTLWDERLTTSQAQIYMNMDNRRGKKRAAVIDAVAASLILESYLGFEKNKM
jgi:putative Holliday junction resolvase